MPVMSVSRSSAPSLRSHEEGEQLELDRGQVHHLVSDGHFVAIGIEYEIADDDLLLDGEIKLSLHRALERFLDAKDQFERVEGYGDVIVGAEFKAEDALLFGCLLRNDDKRHMLGGRVRLQLPASLEASDLREGQAEDDQGRPVLFGAEQGGRAVGGHDDLERRAAQVIGDKVDLLRIVFHQENFTTHRFGCFYEVFLST